MMNIAHYVQKSDVMFGIYHFIIIIIIKVMGRSYPIAVTE